MEMRLVGEDMKKTPYVNLNNDAQQFWKALGLSENQWISAVERARSNK